MMTRSTKMKMYATARSKPTHPSEGSNQSREHASFCNQKLEIEKSTNKIYLAKAQGWHMTHGDMGNFCLCTDANKNY
jgi:hypothetical protein